MNTRALLLSGLAFLTACASTSESANRDQLTAMVGIYPPPQPNQARVRIGVPQFAVHEGIEAPISALAADQAATLATNSQRFDVIERAQLGKLLDEQGLEGIVAQGEMARPAQVRGVEWLLLGKVTSLRIKQDQTGSSFNLGNVPIPGTFGSLGLFGVNNQDTVLKVECGVDLRLVDPSTGMTVCADFAEYNRVDQASAMGLQVLGGNVGSEASIQVSQDDQGRILRLALDDCLRKMLPKVDRMLQQRQVGETTTPTATTAVSSTNTPTGTTKFCSQCGGKLDGSAKFCAGCGTKVGG